MRRDRKLATAAGAMMLAMLTPLPPVQAQEREQEPIRACVPSGFGDTTNIIMRMEAHGWTVNDEPYLELSAENPYAAFDVIWIA